MKRIGSVALCGILCAAAMVIMLLGSLISALDLSAAVAAGLTVAVAVIECGMGWAAGRYAATSVLSLVLLPAKTPGLFYAIIGGIYPIIKAYIERIKNTAVQWAVKLVGFNVFFTVLIWVGRSVLFIEDPIFAFKWYVYLLGNAAFVLYDIAFSRMAMLYVKKIRRRISK